MGSVEQNTKTVFVNLVCEERQTGRRCQFKDLKINLEGIEQKKQISIGSFIFANKTLHIFLSSCIIFQQGGEADVDLILGYYPSEEIKGQILNLSEGQKDLQWKFERILDNSSNKKANKRGVLETKEQENQKDKQKADDSLEKTSWKLEKQVKDEWKDNQMVANQNQDDPKDSINREKETQNEKCEERIKEEESMSDEKMKIEECYQQQDEESIEQNTQIDEEVNQEQSLIEEDQKNSSAIKHNNNNNHGHCGNSISKLKRKDQNPISFNHNENDPSSEKTLSSPSSESSIQTQQDKKEGNNSLKTLNKKRRSPDTSSGQDILGKDSSEQIDLSPPKFKKQHSAPVISDGSDGPAKFLQLRQFQNQVLCSGGKSGLFKNANSSFHAYNPLSSSLPMGIAELSQLSKTLNGIKNQQNANTPTNTTSNGGFSLGGFANSIASQNFAASLGKTFTTKAIFSQGSIDQGLIMKAAKSQQLNILGEIQDSQLGDQNIQASNDDLGNNCNLINCQNLNNLNNANNVNNNNSRQQRNKERTIREAIDMVTRWRDLQDEYRQKHQAKGLQEVADELNISKKVLDYYFQELRTAEFFGFNFNANLDCKMGVLRKFTDEQKKFHEQDNKNFKITRNLQFKYRLPSSQLPSSSPTATIDECFDVNKMNPAKENQSHQQQSDTKEPPSINLSNSKPNLSSKSQSALLKNATNQDQPLLPISDNSMTSELLKQQLSQSGINAFNNSSAEKMMMLIELFGQANNNIKRINNNNSNSNNNGINNKNNSGSNNNGSNSDNNNINNTNSENNNNSDNNNNNNSSNSDPTNNNNNSDNSNNNKDGSNNNSSNNKDDDNEQKNINLEETQAPPSSEQQSSQAQSNKDTTTQIDDILNLMTLISQASPLSIDANLKQQLGLHNQQQLSPKNQQQDTSASKKSNISSSSSSFSAVPQSEIISSRSNQKKKAEAVQIQKQDQS